MNIHHYREPFDYYQLDLTPEEFDALKELLEKIALEHESTLQLMAETIAAVESES